MPNDRNHRIADLIRNLLSDPAIPTVPDSDPGDPAAFLRQRGWLRDEPIAAGETPLAAEARAASLRDRVRVLERENLGLQQGPRAANLQEPLTERERRLSKERSASRARLGNPRYGWRARIREVPRARQLGVISDAFDDTTYLLEAKDAGTLPPIPDVLVRELGAVPDPQADPWLRSLWLARRLARLGGGLTPAQLQDLDALVPTVLERCSNPQARWSAANSGLMYRDGGWALTPRGYFNYPNSMPFGSPRGDLYYPDGSSAWSHGIAVFCYPDGRWAATRIGMLTPDQRTLSVDDIVREIESTTELWPLFEQGLTRLSENPLARQLALIELAWVYLRPVESSHGPCNNAGDGLRVPRRS